MVKNLLKQVGKKFSCKILAHLKTTYIYISNVLEFYIYRELGVQWTLSTHVQVLFTFDSTELPSVKWRKIEQGCSC